MKWYVKILIAFVIIAVIVAAAFFVYDQIQKKQYPLLNYEYESRDSFYEVYEGAEDVDIIDNDSIIMTIEEIEIDEDANKYSEYSDEVIIEYTVENVSDHEVFFCIKCMEINGRMILFSSYPDSLDLMFATIDAGETEKREITRCFSDEFWRDADKPSVDRLSFEVYYREGSEENIEYVRLYPNSERAFKFEPPKADIYDTVYDKKNIILSITDGDELGYFLYNGTKDIIEAEVEIEEINGLANYIDVGSTAYFRQEDILCKSVLPGAYISRDILSHLEGFQAVGHDGKYCYDIHYCITGTKNTIDDTVKIYPYGKDAYDKHSYKYDDNDVVIYEDEEYKVSAISVEKDHYNDNDWVRIFYYIENKTNSEMRFSIPFSQICDTLVYDGFDFEEEKRKHDCQYVTQSNGDTITCDDVYATAMESETCYVALCIGRADEEEDRVQIIVPFKIPFEQEDE